MTADAVGGVWSYVLDLAAGLKPLGVETALAVLGPRPSPDQEAAAEAAGVELAVTDLPLDWTAAGPKDVEEAGWALARIATEREPDIVHLNSPALAASALYPAPVLAACHSCVATWWDAVRSAPLPEDFAWRAELVRLGCHAADRLVAPTAAFADATTRLYGLSRAPSVVRNGRANAFLQSRDAPPEDAVFTAGRLWDEGKNLSTLDRAAARLSVPVRAAGPLEGPNGARIALRFVEALGRLDEAALTRRLGARPIFASTARYEPFGLAVLEAAQAGCALVLSDIPTFRELWDGAAVFVAADDDEALAHAVRHLLADADARALLGRRARDRSRAYTAEAMSCGILGLYRSLLPAAADSRGQAEAAA